MASLKSYNVLSFDVYGTLIDWESGVIAGLQPLLDASSAELPRKHLLSIHLECEKAQQSQTPDMKYTELLSTIHPQIARRLGLPEPTEEQNKDFGQSVGSWPAFPDTVDALRRLRRHYKLVVLSNVDNGAFSLTNAGPLQGIPFDLVLTAQDIGSYKPSQRNFEYMLEKVDQAFSLGKEKVIQTAQSQFHDHIPARQMGIKSAWIVRPGATMGNVQEGKEVYDWKFDTLGHMADTLEAEAGRSL